MKQIILSIHGMTCSACSNGLENYLSHQNGVISASVNLVMSNATVEYDEAVIEPKDIDLFVKQAGFRSLGVYKEDAEDAKKGIERILFICFTVLAVITMYVSMGHMAGIPVPGIFNMHKSPVGYAVSLLVLTSLFLVYGGDILLSGVKNLLHRTPNMDTLVTVGVAASFFYSVYGLINILMGNHSFAETLYFESAAIVIYFIKLGRYIDQINKGKTKDAIKKLVQITPKQAVILVDGEEKTVTLDKIKKGDTVICRPGEKIAVDGEIIEGRAHLDESFVTGESVPAAKSVGAKVIAGSTNYDGYIKYLAEKIGKESTVSEIVRLVSEAASTKAPIARVADKVSGYFVPAVMAIAAVTLLIWLAVGSGTATAIGRFVTVLVVACPCSLGLATPLAIVVSEGVCAEKGILVKKSEILENAQKTDTVVFDKTGTLTYGQLKVSEIKNCGNLSDAEIMRLAGSLESQSSHPIGKAFLSYLKENGINATRTENFKDHSGLGLSGTVEGHQILLGNAKWMAENKIPNTLENEANVLATNGNSIVYIAVNGTLSAVVGVRDILRSDAKKTISALIERKIEPIMLTGDNAAAAKKAADELGIKNVLANVSPAEKTGAIQKLKDDGRFVMMCGDGINDSPALALCDIGVSVNSGTDIAMDSSGVILSGSRISRICDLIEISRKTIRNIKQNLFWAFFYNVLMIPVAAGVLSPVGITINPMIASLAMILSSITVVLNALRLKSLNKKED